jgi:hypothetical protein
MIWLFFVWTKCLKSMHTGFSSQVTGFYAQKEVGGSLSREAIQFGPWSGPRPDSRPDQPPVDRISPARNRLLVWTVIPCGAETFRRAARRPVFSPVPPDWPPNRPACTSAPPNLRRNFVASCFQWPDFHPHINTPSPSWGRIRTSPTIVHLWSSHLPLLQKHQIPQICSSSQPKLLIFGRLKEEALITSSQKEFHFPLHLLGEFVPRGSWDPRYCNWLIDSSLWCSSLRGFLGSLQLSWEPPIELWMRAPSSM